MRETVTLKVGADKYKLVPTHGARSDIEGALKSSVYQIYAAHMGHALTLRELGEIVCAGMEAGGFANPDLDTVAKHLFEAGTETDDFRRTMAIFLAALAWLPEEAKKKIADDFDAPAT